MARCSSCGNEIEPGDRFCGTCGAPAPAEPPRPVEPPAQVASDPKPEPGAIASEPESLPEPEPDAVDEADVPDDEDEPRTGRGKVIAIGAVALVALAALAALGGYAWSSGILGPAEPAPDAAPAPGPAATLAAPDPAQQGDPGFNDLAEGLDAVTEQMQGAEDDQDAGALARTAEIRPGMWSFKRLIYDISTPDLQDTGIPEDSLPIGNEEQDLQCVNAQIAANPGAYAFPAERAGNCVASSYSMANGRYRARMQCTYLGKRRTVTFDGNYDQTAMIVTMNVTVPANEIAGDSYGTRPLLLHYRLEGYQIGPC